MRFAVVNYNGQRQLICKHKLFFEYLELFFAAVSFVVIIEPDFTDCHHFILRGKLFYIAAPVGGQRIEIQRVETDGGIDKRIFFRKSYRLLARYYVRTAGDDARYTVSGNEDSSSSRSQSNCSSS